MPSAWRRASTERRTTGRAGRAPGQTAATARGIRSRTAALRATASCTRSSGRIPGSLHPEQHEVGEPLGEHRAGGAVAHAPARAAPRGRLGDLVCRDPPLARSARHDERLCRDADADHTDGVAQDGRHPGVTLERRGAGASTCHGPAAATSRPRSCARPRPRRAPAAPPRCGRGRPVGADDEHPLPREPLAMGIEQPRRAVQSDRGLAGAGGALDADTRAGVAAHDLVLLGLDGRDDVAHRPDARALDLGGQDRAAPGGRRRVGQMLVLVCRELAPRRPRTGVAGSHPHRGGPGGAVEGRRDSARQSMTRGRRRIVADVAAPDIPPLAAGAVEPTEEQGRAGVVAEGFGPVVEGPCEVCGGDGIGGLDLERLRALAHARQGVAGGVEIGPFAVEFSHGHRAKGATPACSTEMPSPAGEPAGDGEWGRVTAGDGAWREGGAVAGGLTRQRSVLGGQVSG
jgi:hypothetical protein